MENVQFYFTIRSEENVSWFVVRLRLHCTLSVSAIHCYDLRSFDHCIPYPLTKVVFFFLYFYFKKIFFNFYIFFALNSRCFFFSFNFVGLIFSSSFKSSSFIKLCILLVTQKRIRIVLFFCAANSSKRVHWLLSLLFHFFLLLLFILFILWCSMQQNSGKKWMKEKRHVFFSSLTK